MRGNERARLTVVLATIVLNIAAVIVFTKLPWSDWRTGMALNLVDNLIFIIYLLRSRDAVMKHLIVFGLLLGFTELFADAWLVDVTKTLDYSLGGGPLIWRSPLWMPFAWEVVAVQFAVLGEALVGRFKGAGVFLTGLIGAINIPFYEEMALGTRWWAYHNCSMILHTPYYIIIGEFLIAMGIVMLATKLQPLQWPRTILSGWLGGLMIFLCYAVAYRIFP